MWQYFREHYVDFVSSPDCAQHLVEWELYEDLKDETLFQPYLGLVGITLAFLG